MQWRITLKKRNLLGSGVHEKHAQEHLITASKPNIYGISNKLEYSYETWLFYLKSYFKSELKRVLNLLYVKLTIQFTFLICLI